MLLQLFWGSQLHRQRMELLPNGRITVACALTPQQAAEQYKVDADCGLSSSEAEQRLALHGPNCARHACPWLPQAPRRAILCSTRYSRCFWLQHLPAMPNLARCHADPSPAVVHSHP